MEDFERRLLERARRGFLATADADGRPAAVPVCFALVDSPGPGAPRAVTPIDEKPKEARPGNLRRLEDVRANPRVTLAADHYDEDWDRLAWVQLRGTAAVIQPGDGGHSDAVDALRAKYDQYASHALDERPVIRIAPGHVVSWRPTEDTEGI